MGESSPAVVRNTVRRARERKRLTLAQLAARTGSTKQHLSLIERGLVRPHGITQERIADALGMAREVLFPEVLEEAS